MKLKILLLSLSCVFCVTAFGQKVWRPDRQQLKKMQQSKTNATSNFRTLPITSSRSNMEEQWNKLAPSVIPEGEEVYSVKMVDENIMWMVSCTNLISPSSNAPNIFKSTDGGTTWEQFQIVGTEGFYAADISPINDQIAYVVLWGPNFFETIAQDIIYRTLDGGQTWEPYSTYPFAPSYVHFFDEQNGWILGIDSDFWIVMSTTNNGGQTWDHVGGNDWTVPEGRKFPMQNETEFVGTWAYSPSSNYDVKGTTILLGGTNYWISHDMGYNWESLSSPLNADDGLAHGVVALKDSSTYMFSSNLTTDFFFNEATAYGTLDGGRTWTKSNPSINPSAMEYLPGTDHDFIITGIDQGLDPSFNFGQTGTARTTDLSNWEIVSDIGVQSTDFIGENQGVGAFAHYPGFVDGTLYSWGEKVVLPYDATVTRNNDYKYTIVTLNHLEEEVSFDYQIENIGLNDLEGTIARMEVLRNGELVFIDSTEITIENDATENFVFNYLPDEVGFYEFKISTNHSEIGAGFFSDSRFLEVGESTLAKDNGMLAFSFTLIPDESEWASGYFGSEYKLLASDQLTGISIVVSEFLSDSTAQFNVLIKEVDENGMISEEDIYKSDSILASKVYSQDFRHITYQLPEPVDLAPGRYVFAVGQDSSMGRVSFGYTNQPDEGAWLYSPAGFGGEPLPWTNIPNSNWQTLMIRPQFGTNMSTNTTEALAETIPITVYPNPFQEELTILLEYFDEPEVQVQIFDLSGKLWKNTITNHHQVIHQNVSNLPKGLYLLRLTSKGFQKSIKVVKQ